MKSSGSDLKKKPATHLRFFYERTLSTQNIWGVSLSYHIRSLSAGEYVFPFGHEGFYINDSGTDYDLNTLALGAYTRMALTESMDITPSLQIAKTNRNDDISSKSYLTHFNLLIRTRL